MKIQNNRILKMKIELGKINRPTNLLVQLINNMELNDDKREIVIELHKQARKNLVSRRVVMKGINNLCQADLVEMGKRLPLSGNRYRYILKKGL